MLNKNQSFDSRTTLGPRQTVILDALREGPATIKDLATRFSLDMAGVDRALRSLICRELVTRKTAPCRHRERSARYVYVPTLLGRNINRLTRNLKIGRRLSPIVTDVPCKDLSFLSDL